MSWVRAARVGFVLTQISIGGALTGCVGVLDPIVGPTSKAPPNANFTQAVSYANDLKDQYRLALRNQARLTTWGGPALFPLAASSAGLAIFGTHSVTVGALGLGGATALGTAAYLRSSPAQLAYLSGAEALTCAVNAVLPFQLASPGASGAQDFEQALRRIGPDLSRVKTQISLIRGLMDVTGTTDAAKAHASSEIAVAEQNIADAEHTRNVGLALQQSASLSAGRLVSATERIRSEVDRGIVQNLPDIAAITSTISGLTGGYKQITAVAPQLRSLTTPPTQRSGPGPQGANLNEALQVLAGDVETLAADQALVAAVVNAVNTAKPAQDLEQCGVKPDDIAAELSTDPHGTLAFAASDTARRFTVKGGRAPYDANLGSATSDISIHKLGFSDDFEVDRTSAAQGTYIVLVRDAAGRTTSLEVSIPVKAGSGAVAPTAGSASGSDSSPSSSQSSLDCSNPKPTDDVSRCTTPEDFKKLNLQLCMPPAKQIGVLVPEAIPNLVKFKQDELRQEQPNRLLTPDAKSALLGSSPEATKARCPIQLDDQHAVASVIRALVAATQAASFQTVGMAQVDSKTGEIAVSICLRSGTPDPALTPDNLRETLLESAKTRFAQVNNKPLQTNVTPSQFVLLDSSSKRQRISKISDILHCK